MARRVRGTPVRAVASCLRRAAVAVRSAVAAAGVRAPSVPPSSGRGRRGRYQILRKRTGLPWSWSLRGPVAGQFLEAERFLCPPPPSRGVASWVTTPLTRTVRWPGSVSLPSMSFKGRRQMMTKVCHWPGGRRALTIGGGDAVDGGGGAVWVGGVGVVVEHLDFCLAHEEDAAVAAALAFTFYDGGGGPLDVELAVSEAFFGADVAGVFGAEEGAVGYDPAGGAGFFIVGAFPFF